MAEVLVLVEHTDGEVKKVTFELLTIAARLGEPSAVLVGPALLVRGPAAKGWVCRLCDTQACGARPGQPCPVTIAALVKPPS